VSLKAFTTLAPATLLLLGLGGCAVGAIFCFFFYSIVFNAPVFGLKVILLGESII
jgi:hypothetical protein